MESIWLTGNMLKLTTMILMHHQTVMTHQFSTEALVLTVRDSGHADRSATLFSRDFGKINALAFGARQVKSRLAGTLQPFAHVTVTLSTSQYGDIVRQSDIINAHRALQEELPRMAYGALISEIVMELWPERQQDVAVFDLLTLVFPILCCRNARITALASGWQLLSRAGFEPVLSNCVGCGKAIEKGFFDVSAGGMMCDSCRSEEGRLISVATLKVVDAMLKLNWQRPGDFTVSSGLLAEAENLLYTCLNYHIEKPLKALSFINHVVGHG